jgi:release factor glutamine methyltransferase
VRLVTIPGVFRPISDSWLLADALDREPLPRGARVLDLCSGSGALAIRAALGGRDREIWAVDVSRRAVLTVRLNAALNGVRVRAIRSDLFAAVGDAQFDVIVSNPPYVPAPEDGLPAAGARRAWDAGRDGRALLDRICAEAPRHLWPGGVVLVVHSSVLGLDTTAEALRAGGLEVDVAARERGSLGPLMEGRREYLEAAGMLAPGTRQEEVVVVRGIRSAGGSSHDASSSRVGATWVALGHLDRTEAPVSDKKARDIMSSDCTCIGENDTLLEAAKKLAELDVGSLPICGEDDRLKGMLTDRDIVVKALAEGKDPGSTMAGDLGQGDGETVTIGADDPIDEALRTMIDHKVRRLPVIDDHRLVGVLSQADIATNVDKDRVGDLVEAISAAP